MGSDSIDRLDCLGSNRTDQSSLTPLVDSARLIPTSTGPSNRLERLRQSLNHRLAINVLLFCLDETPGRAVLSPQGRISDAELYQTRLSSGGGWTLTRPGAGRYAVGHEGMAYRTRRPLERPLRGTGRQSVFRRATR